MYEMHITPYEAMVCICTMVWSTVIPETSGPLFLKVRPSRLRGTQDGGTILGFVVLRMVAYMDRLDYVSMLSNELCYAETVEAGSLLLSML